MKQENEKFCHECGEIINIKAEICPKCGVRQLEMPIVATEVKANPEETEQKTKWLTALLLCWFLGAFGVHRFYTGHTAIGVVQLLTAGGCGVWTIVDLIMIITGNFKDADGNPIKNN